MRVTTPRQDCVCLLGLTSAARPLVCNRTVTHSFPRSVSLAPSPAPTLSLAFIEAGPRFIQLSRSDLTAGHPSLLSLSPSPSFFFRFPLPFARRSFLFLSLSLSLPLHLSLPLVLSVPLSIYSPSSLSSSLSTDEFSSPGWLQGLPSGSLVLQGLSGQARYHVLRLLALAARYPSLPRYLTPSIAPPLCLASPASRFPLGAVLRCFNPSPSGPIIPTPS